MPEDDVVGIRLELEPVHVSEAIPNVSEPQVFGGALGSLHRTLGDVDRLVQSGEVVLRETALELPAAAAQGQHAVERPLRREVLLDEVTESIRTDGAGDLEVDAVLNRGMLEPVPPPIDAPRPRLLAPDFADPIESRVVTRSRRGFPAQPAGHAAP